MWTTVTKWRFLHKYGEVINNVVVKPNLDEAAKMIGISRKTLDDYLNQ